jgi:hypothetical protein
MCAVSSAPSAPRHHLILAGLLIVLFLVQSFSASLRKSPVFDEAPHIAAGLSYLETRVFHANLQHPPLLKEIGAAFLSMAGIHWPKSPDADAVIRGGPEGDKKEWPVGIQIIHDNGADRVLFWGRLPFILLGGLLGALIYWWGRELVGSTAALCALFFYALDPAIVAHSALVTTDVGVTAFAILFLFLLWRYLQEPSWRRLVFCGIALGLVLGAKFSAVFLLPCAAILMAAAVVTRKEVDEPQDKRFAKAGPNTPCPCGSGKKYKKCHGAGASPGKDAVRTVRRQELIRAAGMFTAMCAIAGLVIQVLYPFLYVKGLNLVNADHRAGYQAYLHGALSPHFYTYFAVVYLVKEPLAIVALSIAGLVLLLRQKSFPILTKLFLLLTPVVLFLAVSFLADNLGIRYIIPTLPFAYLLAGLALARLFESVPAWGRYAGAALCLWVMVEAIGIYPDHLSYFNESACLLTSPSKIGLDGGSRCGPQWLDDSNIDWGQGLKQLHQWLDAHANGRPVYLSYFGIYPPENYGIHYQNVSNDQLVGNRPPGLYAISAQTIARMPAIVDTMAPGAANWLRGEPEAVVGHAFYIFNVR